MVCFPNAKINIGLNIVGKRADGYHNIETIFYPVGLSDILEIVEDQLLEQGVCNLKTSGIDVSEAPGGNLVVKAYNLLNRRQILPGISVFLHKIIPIGAGLGGGSSDAAFMLTGLNTLFGLGLSTGELEDIASEVGSDCSFFIRNSPVFACEKGDKFKEIYLFLRGYYLMIIWPGIHVSTPEAYTSVAPLIPDNSLTELIKLPLHKWRDCVINDFEKSVFLKYPEIKSIKNKLYEEGAIYASMSGSGSSVYGLFADIPENTEIFNNYYHWCGRLK